jgi:hypothetical protein
MGEVEGNEAAASPKADTEEKPAEAKNAQEEPAKDGEEGESTEPPPEVEAPVDLGNFSFNSIDWEEDPSAPKRKGRTYTALTSVAADGGRKYDLYSTKIEDPDKKDLGTKLDFSLYDEGATEDVLVTAEVTIEVKKDEVVVSSTVQPHTQDGATHVNMSQEVYRKLMEYIGNDLPAQYASTVRHRILFTPKVQGAMPYEQWNEAFGPLLKEHGYTQPEADKGIWEHVYEKPAAEEKSDKKAA